MLGDLTDWLALHQQWIGIAIFVVSLTESLAIAGLIVPGVFLLFAFSAMAAGADISLTEAIAWAFVGAVCGDLLSFALGRRFHQDIRRLSLFRQHPQWINRGEHFFKRYGWLSVVLGRFVGPIRPIIPLVAGMFDMPAWRFVLINLLSALIWAPVYLIPGYTAGRAAQWAVPPLFWNQALSLLAGATILLTGILYLLRLQRRWSRLAAAAACLLALLILRITDNALDIFSSTLSASSAHLHLPGTERLPLLGPNILLGAVPLLCLLIPLRRWSTIALLLGSQALTLLLCWLGELNQGNTLAALTLAALIAVLVASNRGQHFWLRSVWLLYPLPLLALITGNLLQYQSAAPLDLLRGLLGAAAASLLTCWLVERVGPIPPLPPLARWVIALCPYAVAAWLLL